MTKKKSTKNWLKKHTKDKYVKMSMASRYRSRAFHKLQEIDEKYKVIRSSNIIIDLGASPGSWSEFISRNFAKDYGVLLIDGPLSGITSRAVITISAEDKILHSELVSEIANEPDYQAALDSLAQ